ncbi:MAG: type I restriction enzyme M protein [Cellvibrionaceae bacterium]
MSLVQMIVNFIEPDHGSVIDPACGSGGMFVQSAHFIEKMHKNPQDVATFYGAEKNPTTIRFAKMNLAVHGLEGKIQKAISYYEDPHDFLSKANFVMANPPFNVDDEGRAGFVMSSQASSAGGQEAEVRRKLVESGHVGAMVAIRSNFFYTRTVPCELWFLNKNKPAHMKDKVLMLDARNVYTKATRKIYDFSTEQLANLTSIVWLYRGQKERFLGLVESYLQRTLDNAQAAKEPMDAFIASLDELIGKLPEIDEETTNAFELLAQDIRSFESSIEAENKVWDSAAKDSAALNNVDLKSAAEKLEPIAETSRDLIKQIDQLYKFAEKQEKDTREQRKKRGDLGLNKLVKELDEQRKAAVEHLKQVRTIFKQAHWLQERFPDAELRDVEGLVKLVDIEEIKANNWSLTPGRYVGVAPEIEDEDFDFEETLRDIHIELKGLNEEASTLAAQIQKNFEELGI